VNQFRRTLVIAEAGVNHNGSLQRALELVDAAAAAGADIVKFQTFRAGRLASRSAPKADYQKRETGTTESQLDMLRALELDEATHRALISRCAEKGIEFLSTPFDHESLDLLVRTFELPRLKLGSGDLTNAPLLLAIARTAKPLILSTGMATLSEVEEALGVLAFGYASPPHATPSISAFRSAYESDAGQQALRNNVALLHCTTEYPTPVGDVNLRAMDTLRQAFGLEVGYSDHTQGTAISLAAVARGATIIEKHFTLDRNLPGPDHKSSLEPEELAAMAANIRRIETALGDGIKRPAESERPNRIVARKSLVAARTIQAGERFSAENIDIKRPGGGITPLRYWEFLGRQSPRRYAADEVIES
jgi:N-acetylneuraminate synthase